MKISTIPRYLFGSRQAILDVASSPWSALVGVILVISAGLAREYDGEDLVHEPWHVLRPLGASLVSGTTLFLIVHLSALHKTIKAEHTPPPFMKAWRVFLGLFWFTAPMAWLYAIPYERFMTPVDAISVNLWTLAIVSVWRVTLMTRVIHVVYGLGYVPSFFLVMLFSNAVVFVAVMLAPKPVIDVMGGLRYPEREALIGNVTFSVMLLSVLTAPIWILGAVISISRLKPTWPHLPVASTRNAPRGILLAAAASVVAFVPLLFITQPEQMNRRKVERLLTSGEVQQAFAHMSRRSIADFPPQWDPPPRFGYRDFAPSLQEIQEAMSREWPADWVAHMYITKLDLNFRDRFHPRGSSIEWAEIIQFREANGIHGTYRPEDVAIAQFLLDRAPELSEPARAALQRLVQIGTSNSKDNQP